MPAAARVGDSTAHGIPLSPGPGSLTITIGYKPAWRALPAGVGAGLEQASNTMKQLMDSAQLTPPNATAQLAQVQAGAMQSAGQAAGNGNPGAPGSSAGAFGGLTGGNAGLTSTYAAASAAPGGQPAATTAYTQGIKALAAVAASAAFAAVASMVDTHLCSVPCPVPPHGPGVVTQGSSTVFFDNLPAARKGDKVFEACGGSDDISVGEASVDIG